MIPLPEVKKVTPQDYFQIIWKRVWIVITFLVIGLVSLIMYNVLLPKIYEADTTILLKASPLQLMDPRKDPVSEPWKGEDYYTALRLLRSFPVAERVIRKLNLVITPKELLETVDIKPLRRTSMVSIVVSGRDPLLITDIANTWVREFIHQDMERRIGMAKYGMSRLESQLDETLQKMQSSEKELNEFLEEHGALADQEQLVERIKEQKIKTEKETFVQSSRYKEKHQKIVSLQQQLKDLDEQLRVETEKLLNLQEQAAGYSVLKKKADAYRAIYEDLITREKNLDTSRGLALASIRVIDVAQVPDKPKEPPIRKQVMLLIMLVLSSIGLCVGLEYLDPSIKVAEEVEFYVKMPFLGYSPYAKDEFKKEKIKDFGLICHEKPYSRVAEAFRNVEVSLDFSAPKDNPYKALLITSAEPKEGKTFITANLGTIFTRAKEPTLLIDANMRTGELSKVFKAESKKGLSDLLKGEGTLEELAIKTQVPNLFLLPAGALTPAPIDLLESKALDDLLKKAKDKYYRILIDVPSIKIGPETMLLGEKCDGVVYAIKQGVTSYREIDSTRKKLEKRINIIGAVLNNAELAKEPYYYAHYFKQPAKKEKAGNKKT